MAEELQIRRIFWHGRKGPSGGMTMSIVSCFRCSDWAEQAVESVSWLAPAMLEMLQGRCRLKDFWSETQWEKASKMVQLLWECRFELALTSLHSMLAP